MSLLIDIFGLSDRQVLPETIDKRCSLSLTKPQDRPSSYVFSPPRGGTGQSSWKRMSQYAGSGRRLSESTTITDSRGSASAVSRAASTRTVTLSFGRRAANLGSAHSASRSQLSTCLLRTTSTSARRKVAPRRAHPTGPARPRPSEPSGCPRRQRTRCAADDDGRRPRDPFEPCPPSDEAQEGQSDSLRAGCRGPWPGSGVRAEVKFSPSTRGVSRETPAAAMRS